MTKIETEIADLIDLGAASVETKGSFPPQVIDNKQQHLPDTMGLLAD
jgi:hypothetical protein